MYVYARTYVYVLELKQILDSLGYTSIRIPREYSNTRLYRFSALLLTFFVIKHIFQSISVIK